MFNAFCVKLKLALDVLVWGALTLAAGFLSLLIKEEGSKVLNNLSMSLSESNSITAVGGGRITYGDSVAASTRLQQRNK